MRAKEIVWTTTLISVSVFFAGCDVIDSLGLSKPTARMMGMKFEDVKLDSANLLFDVEVTNPYSVDLPLTNLDYDLSTGAEPFLNGKADLLTTIPAKSKKTVSLPANINYLNMLKALKGVMPGAKIPYTANLGLSVNAPAVGAMRLPLKKEGEVVLPKMSDVNAKDVWNLIKSK